jgi:hypothetical protein
MLTILGWVTGLAGPIAQITNKILDLQKSKLDAETNVQKAKIDQEIELAHDRRMVLVAEAGSRINAYMRSLIALGPGLYLFKIFAYDKVIGSFLGCNKDGGLSCPTFNTDPLDSNLWAVATAVVGFYFLASIFKK